MTCAFEPCVQAGIFALQPGVVALSPLSAGALGDARDPMIVRAALSCRHADRARGRLCDRLFAHELQHVVETLEGKAGGDADLASGDGMFETLAAGAVGGV